MATLFAFDASQTLSMFDGLETAHGVQITNAPSIYEWTTPPAGGAFFTITAFGVLDDFAAPAGELPIAGTVNAIVATHSAGGGTPFYTVAGMTGDLPSMMTVEGYWRGILAGDTTIFGPAADRLQGAGDFINVSAGEVLTGGNDTVTLTGDYSSSAAFNRFSGDADEVEGNGATNPAILATLVGGDDVIFATGAPILNGDAERADDAHVTGGDDAITIESTLGGLFDTHAITGDVRDVREGATVIGGDDLFTLHTPNSGITGGGFDVYGDVQLIEAGSSVQYGNDTFVLIDKSDADIFGDAGTAFGGEGGNDVLTSSGQGRVFFTGDFESLNGTGSGGNDVFTSGDVLFATAASGDIGTGALAADETFVGGDDVIDLAGSRDVAFYFGDASVFTGRLVGGDDFIRIGESSSDAFFGDVSTLSGATSHLKAGSDTIFGGTASDLVFGDFGSFTPGATFDLSGTGGDLIDGGAGNDTIQGQLGADLIFGGMGNDTMDGNGGGIDDLAIDTVAFDRIAMPVFVDLAVGRAIGQGIDTLANFGRVIGSSLNDAISGDINANALIGGGGNDTLNGREGADTLDGGIGIDSLTGGTGNDTYIVDRSTDLTIELPGGGVDLVSSSVSRTLSVNTENLILTGTASIDGNGNASANIINGNSGNNILRGDAGVDTLGGGAGNDILLGGTGRDTLSPGADTVRDILRYAAPGESSGTTRDLVLGMDLNGEDKFDFLAIPTSLGATVTLGALNAASFNADLASAVNAGLAANGAILFDPSSGDQNLSGHIYLVVDVDGNGSYASSADYVIQLSGTTGALALDDFI